MSTKRSRKKPEMFCAWKEGEKHVPMALRKDKQKQKEEKVKQKAYQKEYREKKKLEKENKSDGSKPKNKISIKKK